jgi:hypothetical protein
MFSGRPTWILPVLATVLIHTFLTAVYIRKHHRDPSSLVCVGENRVGKPPYEAVTFHTPAWSNGYDGQFYYVIARAPWDRQPQGLHGIDWSGPRQLRILYPAVSWLMSAGDARLLFWIMPAVNVAALAGLTASGAVFARRCGLNAWWGFVLPFAINAGMPVLRNLTEPLAMLGVFGLLGGWLLQSSWWVMALCAGTAVFSREQNVALVAFTTLGAVLARRWSIAGGLGLVFGVWLAWVSYLRGLYGEWPFLPAEGNLGLPFAGICDRWSHLFLDTEGAKRPRIIQAITMAQLAVEMAAALYLVARPGDWIIRGSMLAGAVLAITAGRCVYADLWSYGRVFFWLPVGIWLSASIQGRTAFLWLLTPAFLWHLLAVLGWV